MMEKKIHSKSKLLPKQNGEKFQRFRSKLKKTFSKTMTRSFSIPRSAEKNISGDNKHVLRENQLRHKSNDSSRSSTPDINWFSKMSRSTNSNDNHERIELHNLKTNNNNHHFISQVSEDKFTFCDVCNEELMPMGSILSCKYCQLVSHEKCCDNIDLKCHNNRLSVMTNVLDFEKLHINPEVDLKVHNSSNSSSVRLRKKTLNSDISPTDSEYYSCNATFINDVDLARASFNFYHGGVETVQCRDSLVSVTSITSISSLISQISYDFTTLDRDSIQAYGIEVNPINQRATASLDESLTDVSSLDSSYSIHSDSIDYFIKPSYIYNDKTMDMLRIDWTMDDLMNKMIMFNQNNFGLISEIKSYKEEKCLLGTVRVNINLLRPIKMQFATRPSSIFDVISTRDSEDLINIDGKVETLWLPRGTSKRLYVNQSTTTSEVINGLLKKFHIKANPKKFGLYEHTIEGERRVSVRKLMDVECPLAMILMWAEQGIDKLNEIMTLKRLVLQENETGDIEWTVFSKPELRNFLLILDREEQDCSNKIQLKYSILRNEILRLQNLLKSEGAF